MEKPLTVRWLLHSRYFHDSLSSGPAAAAHPLLEDRFFNRDLSWLSFNDRVLSEAADVSVPPLERLRFATIVSSNLDEFFMVRVAEVARLARRSPGHRFPDGITAAQVLAQIREHALRQKARQATVLADILAALHRQGIEICTQFPEDPATDEHVKERLPEVKFVLKPASEQPTHLLSEMIHVFVRFPGEYAIMTIEDRDSRLLELPSRGGRLRYALLERWLSARAASLFAGKEVIEAFPFKIIREADLRYRPDDESSLEEQIVEAVKHRTRAKVVRLEVDAPAYSEGALFLATALGLDSAALYRFDLPLDLRALARVYNAAALSGAEGPLRYPPVQPQVPLPMRGPRRILDIVRSKDVLLHHPYDSFDVVVRFLEEAARDPQVQEIRHTMYRTSRTSPVLEALREAARRGKKVKAYVEIKARFDEMNNLRWADDLRKAGVKVIRPMGGFKVHSKLTQVLREEDGRTRSYLHLGTGNYHPGTARQYTDLGLLTADDQLGREIADYFKALADREKPPAFGDLLFAPGNLHDEVLAMIREETRLQRAGGGGRIVAKMNALVDPKTIEALYEASSAGVRVELLVRGICCLRPGVRGMSENVRVLSVVDRFLEHSRIFYFRAGGAERIFLSSADWMPRNFYTRYEIAFPVKDPDLKRYVWDVILANGLADNTKAWELKPDGSYARVEPAPGVAAVRSQLLFEGLARRDYKDTVLAGRIL